MRQFAFLLMPVLFALAAPLSAQPLSPHEKMSEIYKLMTLCPGIRIDRKALDRFAMLNGIDMTPGSREERWFLKRAAYERRRLPRQHRGFFCQEGMTRYGPQGGVAKGIVLTN
jgi:hypothetical protein